MTSRVEGNDRKGMRKNTGFPDRREGLNRVIHNSENKGSRKPVL